MFKKRSFMFMLFKNFTGLWVAVLTCCVCVSVFAAAEMIPAPAAKSAHSIPKPAFKGFSAQALAGHDIPAPIKPAFTYEEMAFQKICGEPKMTCGLHYWRIADFKTAAAEFMKLSTSSKRLLKSERAAAAFWAGRSYAASRDKKQAKVMMAAAKQFDPMGFYGALAAESLKQDVIFDVSDLPILNFADHYMFDVDPALVHAIVMQESRFNPAARSRVGAMGLMQLMPATARYVAKQSGIQAVSTQRLADPEINVDLGQRYIQYLLNHGAVDGDLISLLVAYNGGPGNLRRWRSQLSDVDDVLLFVELLPSAQTRDYVRRVMSNYWAYRQMQGRKTPVLTAMAKGETLSYETAAADLPYRDAAQH